MSARFGRFVDEQSAGVFRRSTSPFWGRMAGVGGASLERDPQTPSLVDAADAKCTDLGRLNVLDGAAVEAVDVQLDRRALRPVALVRSRSIGGDRARLALRCPPPHSLYYLPEARIAHNWCVIVVQVVGCRRRRRVPVHAARDGGEVHRAARLCAHPSNRALASERLTLENLEPG